MIYIGIDPGKDGAMAVITPTGEYIVPFGVEGYTLELRRLGAGDARCCLERVNAMPGQGVTSMFKFGENFGFIQELL